MFALVCENFVDSSKEQELLVHNNRLELKEVEFFNRNKNVGIQLRGSLTFLKWSELSHSSSVESIVGLTSQGALYHVIKLDGRIIARKLSGKIKVENFKVSDQGRILVQDSKSSVWVFSENMWEQSPQGRHFKSFMATWGITGIGFNTILHLLARYTEIFGERGQSLFLFDLNYPIFEGFVVLISGIAGGLVEIMKYDSGNIHPSGFVRVQIPYKGLEWMSSELDFSNRDVFMRPQTWELPDEMPAELTHSYSE